MKRSHTKSGFSLIEIILALLVVAIGITAMLGLLGSTLDSSSRTRDDLHMTSFADLVINYCHSQPDWDQIKTSNTLSLPDYTGTQVDLLIDTVAPFTCNLPASTTNSVETYTLTYLLHITEAVPRKTKRISLSVWPGYSTNSRPQVFYTELYNWTDQ